MQRHRNRRRAELGEHRPQKLQARVEPARAPLRQQRREHSHRALVQQPAGRPQVLTVTPIPCGGRRPVGGLRIPPPGLEARVLRPLLQFALLPVQLSGLLDHQTRHHLRLDRSARPRPRRAGQQLGQRGGIGGRGRRPGALQRGDELGRGGVELGKYPGQQRPERPQVAVQGLPGVLVAGPGSRGQQPCPAHRIAPQRLPQHRGDVPVRQAGQQRPERLVGAELQQEIGAFTRRRAVLRLAQRRRQQRHAGVARAVGQRGDQARGPRAPDQPGAGPEALHLRRAAERGHQQRPVHRALAPVRRLLGQAVVHPAGHLGHQVRRHHPAARRGAQRRQRGAGRQIGGLVGDRQQVARPADQAVRRGDRVVLAQQVVPDQLSDVPRTAPAGLPLDVQRQDGRVHREGQPVPRRPRVDQFGPPLVAPPLPGRQQRRQQRRPQRVGRAAEVRPRGSRQLRVVALAVEHPLDRLAALREQRVLGGDGLRTGPVRRRLDAAATPGQRQRPPRVGHHERLVVRRIVTATGRLRGGGEVLHRSS